FAFSRNPIYVAFAIILIGEFLIFPNWISLIYLGAATWLFHRQILREEEYLKGHYGRAYEQYCRRVRRYLGAASLTAEYDNPSKRVLRVQRRLTPHASNRLCCGALCFPMLCKRATQTIPSGFTAKRTRRGHGVGSTQLTHYCGAALAM